MRQTLEALVGKYSIYSARRPEFDTGTNVPFRVSPHPFCLPNKQKNEIRIIGSDVLILFILQMSYIALIQKSTTFYLVVNLRFF